MRYVHKSDSLSMSAIEMVHACEWISIFDVCALLSPKEQSTVILITLDVS